MKKYSTISLFIFFAITVAVITAGLISANKNQSVVADNLGSANFVDNVSGANSAAQNNDLILNLTELSKHNSSQSCWLLISGKIYECGLIL